MKKISVLMGLMVCSAAALAAEAVKGPPKPGIPGAQEKVAALKLAHTIELGGFPDWMMLTGGSV